MSATEPTKPIEMEPDHAAEPAPEPTPESSPPEIPRNSDASTESSPSLNVDAVIGDAIKDQHSIAHQLSDAISQIIFASFDDASKNLASRTQATEVVESATVHAQDIQLDHSAISSPPAFKVPHQRNSEFVGRIAALSQLFGMWNPGQTSQARIAIVGLGGIG